MGAPLESWQNKWRNKRGTPFSTLTSGSFLLSLAEIRTVRAYECKMARVRSNSDGIFHISGLDLNNIVRHPFDAIMSVGV